MRQSRILYIDRLRGLAVLGMFFVHPAVAWMTPAARQGAYFTNLRMVSGMVAPVFLFLAGLSIAVIAEKGREKGDSGFQLKRRVALRGIQIWLVGYGFHTFSYLFGGCHGDWHRILKVDVLHCIGASLAMLPWIVWPKKGLNIPAILYAFLVPFLSMVLYRLPIETVLPVGVSGYFKTNAPRTQFAFIPYSTWIAFGMAIGSFWFKRLSTLKGEVRLWGPLLLTAAGMYAAGRGLKWVFYTYEIDQIGVSVPQVRGLPFVFWIKGAFVLAILFVARLSAPLLDKFKPNVLVLLGRTSLFGYCVHLAIIYEGVGGYFKHRLSEIEHFTACVVLTAVMLLLSFAWSRLRDGYQKRQRRKA